jgi:uncharacterized protein (DUF1684 family)
MECQRVIRFVVLFAVAAVCGCGGERRQGATPVTTEAHAVSVQAWRDKHEADYRRDWVSIAGLHFLSPGTHTVGSGNNNDIVLAAGVPPTIGRLIVAEGSVRYEPEPGVGVLQRDQPIKGPIVLKAAGSPAAEEIVIGDVRLVVHVSGERLSLRVRDPKGELATQFLGFTWFPIDPAYRVTGRFIPDAEPRTMSVLNTFNDVDTYPTEGVVEFELHGQTLRLRPFTTRPKRFYFVFRDASSGKETYETARFLYSDLLEDGTSVLDFNEAYNPPCAFNPYTTCPLPLRENILPVKILAGEKAYPHEVKLPAP